MSTIIYLAPSEASSHSTHSKKVETKQKSEPKGSKICFSRPNYKWASAMTTEQLLSHITAISCFVSVLGWKKCVSPPIALLRWKPCWFGSLILMIHIFAICGSEQLLHCQVAPTQRQVTLVRAGAPLGAAIAISVPGLEIGPSFSRVGNTRLEVSPTGINMYKPSKWEWSINTL